MMIRYLRGDGNVDENPHVLQNLAERMAMGTTAKPKFSATNRMERSRGTRARPRFSEPHRAEIELNTDKDQVL
jgi:hypothetical protein